MQPGSLLSTSELNSLNRATGTADLFWHLPVRIQRTEGKADYCDGLDNVAVMFERSLNNLIRSQGSAEGEV
jgi:hypothetical protein